MNLFILAAVVACVSWTITHEEIFKEVRGACINRSKTCKKLLSRKIFYMPTCEYCLSHWTALALLVITNYRLGLQDWRGYIIAEFSLVAIANIYMTLYLLLIKKVKSFNGDEY